VKQNKRTGKRLAHRARTFGTSWSNTRAAACCSGPVRAGLGLPRSGTLIRGCSRSALVTALRRIMIVARAGRGEVHLLYLLSSTASSTVAVNLRSIRMRLQSVTSSILRLSAIPNLLLALKHMLHGAPVQRRPLHVSVIVLPCSRSTQRNVTL
jgi:hypothetical protein